MRRYLAVGGALALLSLAMSGPARALAPPSPWDGTNPFKCQLQFAGFGPVGPSPMADPYCIEFDKRRQNLTQLGVIDFLSKEPARTAAALNKCFYFQSDHWRGSIVQDNAATKTYEWDGHYFFDKARGDGGAWVTNFNINGHTYDPTSLPGFPAEYAKFFGPGTGGVITHNDIPADPLCAQRAKREPGAIYASASNRRGCFEPTGSAGPRGIGPVALGDAERRVREALGDPALVKRGFLRYCLKDGADYMVGQPGDRSGELGPASDEPTAMLLTNSPAWALRGVRAGSSLRALRRAFPHARRPFRARGASVYELTRRAGLVAGVAHRRVRFIAVFDRGVIRSRAALRSYLARSS